MSAAEIQVAEPMCVTLTDGERSLLTPEQLARHEKEMERQVFGEGFKRDRHGNPIPQGIGSPGNENRNHFEALKQRELEGKEPPGAYDRAVAEIWERDPPRAKKLGLLQPAPQV